MGSTRLFVYGTLARDQPNANELRGALFCKRAHTRSKYTLYDLGEYPAIVDEGACAIVGEVYEVDSALLVRLDRFEGVPDLFERKSIELDDGTIADAYFMLRSRVAAARVIENGNWAEYASKNSNPASARSSH